MKLKIYKSLLFLLLMNTTIQAQQTFLATGNSITTINGSISYSVGQILNDNVINSTVQINQGIQYPYDIYKVYGNFITPLKKPILKVVTNYGSVNQSKLQTTSNYDINVSNGNYILRPTKNNDITKANGVTSVDVLLTQRHILNTSKLNNAYKLIAADVNGDKAINSVDVLRIKRLILGTDTTFTKGSGAKKVDRLWEFIDSTYQFPDTTNPFPFKDSINISNLTSNKNNQTFIGVKLGDVNYDWNPAVARQMPVNSLQLIVDRKEQASTVRYTLSTFNFKDLLAFQYTLHFDNTKFEFVGIENNKLGIDFSDIQATATGNIAMLWTDKNANSKTLENGSELFTLVLKAKGLITDNDLALTNDIAEVEAWDNEFKKHNIILTKQTGNPALASCSLSIYPNPSHTLMIVKADKFTGIGTIVIADIYGKEVLKQVVNNQLSTLNVSGLTKGIYMLSLLTEQGRQTQKIIIE